MPTDVTPRDLVREIEEYFRSLSYPDEARVCVSIDEYLDFSPWSGRLSYVCGTDGDTYTNLRDATEFYIEKCTPCIVPLKKALDDKARNKVAKTDLLVKTLMRVAKELRDV